MRRASPPRPTTLAGAVLGVSASALLAGWLLTPLLVPFAALGLALATLAPWLAARSLRRVRVQSAARVTAMAGTRFELPLRVEHVGSRATLRDVDVVVTLDDALPGSRADLRHRSARGYVSSLVAGESRVLAPSLRLARRGRRERATVRLSTTAPLGLVYRERIVEVPVDVLVLPSLGTIVHPPAAVAARPGARQVGRSRRSAGDEWRELREWREGMSLRRVHWRTSARRGCLVVREFDGQERPDVHLMLRVGDQRSAAPRSAEAASLREEAVSLVATLAEYCLRRGHGVRVSFPGSATRPTKTAHGARALLPVLVRLAGWLPEGGTDGGGGTVRTGEVRVVVSVGRGGGARRRDDVWLVVGDPSTEATWRRRRDPRRLPLGLGLVARQTVDRGDEVPA